MAHSVELDVHGLIDAFVHAILVDGALIRCAHS
jgi:hypothetical protein